MDTTATTPPLQKISNLSQLHFVRQLVLMGGLAASIALGVAVVLWSQTPDYKLLYAGLSPQDSAKITASAAVLTVMPQATEKRCGSFWPSFCVFAVIGFLCASLPMRLPRLYRWRVQQSSASTLASASMFVHSAGEGAILPFDDAELIWTRFFFSCASFVSAGRFRSRGI